MPSDDIVVSAKGLGKTYRLFDHPAARIKQFFSLGIKRYCRQFTALVDVSFEIRRGEAVGIIGHNGSGKSTLLQLICGILKPTAGEVSVHGRISALLELGSGFDPEFTGRENVFFQGMLMGFSKAQMEERFEEITRFADIGDFIDQPVRTYSSGMFVRLAFAVAVSVEPDILVVDEALAVGDNEFQAKCLKRVDEIRKRGGTILMVTHIVEQVAHHCDRVLMLDHGRLIADGDTSTTLAACVEKMRFGAESPVADSFAKRAVTRETEELSRNAKYNPKEVRWGDGKARIIGLTVLQNGCEDPDSLSSEAAAEVVVRVRFAADIEQPIYGLTLKSSDGVIVMRTNSRELLASSKAPSQKSGDTVQVRFGFIPSLSQGNYTLSLGVASEEEGEVIANDRRYDVANLRVVDSSLAAGSTGMKLYFELCEAS